MRAHFLRRLLPGFLFLLAFSTVEATELQAGELKAGVARIDITPPLSLNCPLGGYGERMNKPAVGIHDRIFAKAVSFSDGHRKFVLVTADLLGFPPPFKPALVERLKDEGVTLDSLILLPSHSHTSIEMNAFNSLNTYKIPQIGIHDPAILEFLLEKFSPLIRDAFQNPVSVRIGSSSEKIPGFNRNRRHQGGFVDEDLTVCRIETQKGKPLAALINFTAHPTFMGADHMLFSGDWPGHLQRTVESLAGEGVIALYFNGAEGDQAPQGRPDSGPSPWERAERYGRDLGIQAHRLWNKTPVAEDVPFAFHRQEIQLPQTSWHPKFMETGGAEYGLTEELLREMLPKIYPRKTASVSLRLGDFLVIGIPGEMAAELGRTIKQSASKATGAAHPVIGGLADEWDSYILPAAEYRLGGYEASVSFYGETLGETIVKGAIEGVSSLDQK